MVASSNGWLTIVSSLIDLRSVEINVATVDRGCSHFYCRINDARGHKTMNRRRE